MLPRRRLIILCNALDDRTRIERGITTDSPAASRKVFLAARAIAATGVKPVVVSLGRGRANGSGDRFPTTVRRHQGVPVVYLRFSHRRVISELVSLFAPIGVLCRLRRPPARKTIVFYNQLLAYLPALVAARLTGYFTVLDLEDSATGQGGMSERLTDLIRQLPFEWLCRRAMLACSMIARETRLRPTLCYYGTVEQLQASRDWSAPQVHVLLGGTIAPDTGALLLADAISRLRQEQPDWVKSVVFEVTGKGPSLPALEELAADPRAPKLIVHGRTTDAEYRAIIERAHVGLALKPNTGDLAHTTFPSKVTEMAAAGMLVLSTDISDVRKVLGDGARYLERDDAALLVERLAEIVTRRTAASESAASGTSSIADICAPQRAGKLLADFLFPEPG